MNQLILISNKISINFQFSQRKFFVSGCLFLVLPRKPVALEQWASCISPVSQKLFLTKSYHPAARNTPESGKLFLISEIPQMFLLLLLNGDFFRCSTQNDSIYCRISLNFSVNFPLFNRNKKRLTWRLMQ